MLISGSVSGSRDLWLTPKSEELSRAPGLASWATSQILGLPSDGLGTMASPSCSVPPFVLFGGHSSTREAGQNSPFHMGPRTCCFPTQEGSTSTYFSTGNVCHTPSARHYVITYFPKKETADIIGPRSSIRKPSHVEECISIFFFKYVGTFKFETDLSALLHTKLLSHSPVSFKTHGVDMY